MKSHVVDFRPQYLVTSYRYEPENKPKENLHISNNAISFILLTCKKQLHKRKKYAFTLLFTIFGVKFLFFKKIKNKKKNLLIGLGNLNVSMFSKCNYLPFK